VAQGAGATTSWAVPVNLLENTRYYWRVRAKDQFTFGPYSTPACDFFVNTVNEAPGVPRINTPSFGSQVNALRPDLTVDNATRPGRGRADLHLRGLPRPGAVAPGRVAGQRGGRRHHHEWTVVEPT
jgi:hypothetical protein